MFHPGQLAGAPIAMRVYFEGKAKRFGVKLPARGLVTNDRAKSGDEQRIDVFRRQHQHFAIGRAASTVESSGLNAAAPGLVITRSFSHPLTML